MQKGSPMKKFVVLGLVALMALTTVSIGAEGDKADKKRPEGKKARDGKRGDAFAKLDLSAEQKEKIGEIRKEFGDKFKAAREAKDKEAFGKLREEMMAAVMEVLNDEQRAKLKKMRDAQGPRDGKRPGKGDGKRPGKKAPDA